MPPKEPDARHPLPAWLRVSVAAFLALLTAALGWLAWRGRGGLDTAALRRQVGLAAPIGVALDADGNLYALDDKYFRVLKIDPRGRIVYRLYADPAQPRTHYEYFNEIAVDPAGHLYAARVVYFLADETVDYEDIVRYSPDGRREAVLFTLDHEGDTEVYDTHLLTLDVSGSRLYFDVRGEETVQLWSVPLAGGEPARKEVTIPAGSADIYNLAGTGAGRLYATSYSGDRILRLAPDGSLVDARLRPADRGVPQIVLADKIAFDAGGALLITDLFNQCVYRAAADGTLSLWLTKADLPGNPERALYKDLWVSPDGRVAVIDQITGSLFVFGPDRSLLRGPVTSGVPSLALWARLLAPWALVAAVGLSFLALAAWVYTAVLDRRVALLLKLVLAFVPLVVLLVAFVSTRIFNQVYREYERETLYQLASIAQAGQRLVDGEAVARIRQTSDYLGDDYNAVCGQLADLLNQGADPWNARLYATVTRFYNGMFYIVADNVATYGVLYPQPLAPNDEYQAALAQGTIQTYEYTDADGTFLEAAAPVRDGSGAPIAVLYVGSSKDDLGKLQEVFRADVRASAAVSAGVFLVVIVGVSMFLLASVNRLRGAVGRMARGEWDAEVHIRSRDEIGELGQGFNAMSRSIRGYIAEITTMSDAYARFVPREFLQLLAKERIAEIELGNQVELDMAILFADIRSFTELSEGMKPQENFNFLNSYLNRVSPVIRSHHGFIDKFLGDGIMALFPRQGSDAVLAAIGLQRELYTYNRHRHNSGYPPISVGVGVHAGRVILGILGEEHRLEGTVIADAVNLASRLEGLTKTYGARIIVTERMVGDGATADHRFLGRASVKGKREPVAIHEVFAADPPEHVRLKRHTKKHFEEGVRLYLAESFAEAARYFRAVHRAHPADRGAAWYERACEGAQR